jgi:hypothetical protein
MGKPSNERVFSAGLGGELGVDDHLHGGILIGPTNLLHSSATYRCYGSPENHTTENACRLADQK